jgi:hypothetical protein
VDAHLTFLWSLHAVNAAAPKLFPSLQAIGDSKLLAR